MNINLKIAVVIPGYKVRNHILDVINLIGPEVSQIYFIDDCCPDDSGGFVENNCKDERIVLIRHAKNEGVGAAVMTGYKAAIEDGMDIFVKVDGDGQMNPSLIPDFVSPIAAGEADYTKGNRFFDLKYIHEMPKLRLWGNVILSFMTKLSSGYWDLFDPTNGYTAIHRDVALHLPFEKISHRYFFETDILFRLNILRAVVVDIPMDAKYSDEISSLKISKIFFEFFIKHIRNFLKRILYNYYLRDVSIASFELPVGLAMLLFGLIFGARNWMLSISSGQESSSGTVMLAALPVIIGLQFLLAFLGHDIRSAPSRPIHRFITSPKRLSNNKEQPNAR